MLWTLPVTVVQLLGCESGRQDQDYEVILLLVSVLTVVWRQGGDGEQNWVSPTDLSRDKS